MSRNNPNFPSVINSHKNVWSTTVLGSDMNSLNRFIARTVRSLRFASEYNGSLDPSTFATSTTSTTSTTTFSPGVENMEIRFPLNIFTKFPGLILPSMIAVISSIVGIFGMDITCAYTSAKQAINDLFMELSTPLRRIHVVSAFIVWDFPFP